MTDGFADLESLGGTSESMVQSMADMQKLLGSSAAELAALKKASEEAQRKAAITLEKRMNEMGEKIELSCTDRTYRAGVQTFRADDRACDGARCLVEMRGQLHERLLELGADLRNLTKYGLACVRVCARALEGEFVRRGRGAVEGLLLHMDGADV